MERRTKFIIMLAGAGMLLFVVAFLIGFFSAPGSNKEQDSHHLVATELPFLPPQATEWRQKAIALAASNSHCPDSFKTNPPLLIVSMDGFRADYLDRQKNPALRTLMEAGVHTPYMRPVFPSKTFPNHYSIVTGLYPESHGIIENNMYDEKLNLHFSLGSKDSFNPSWWKGEPIWITAVNQGKNSATFFWPGSDVKINGTYPTFFKKYDRKVPHTDRVDQIVEWLSLTKERPDVLTLYFEEPDSQGHQHGPDSSQVTKALSYVDQLIDRLSDSLYQKNLLGCFNIVFLSDHGMQSVSCDRAIYPLEKLRKKDAKLAEGIHLYSGPVGRYRTNISEDLISKLIKDLDCISPHLLTTHKTNLPARLHYVNNHRIENVVSLVEPGWQALNRDECSPTLHGQHGYDNKVSTMRAMFIGYGPAFKQNFTSKPFENIELYNLFCELTNLKPAANNGTEGSLYHLLRKPSKQLQLPEKATFESRVYADNAIMTERNKKAACSCPQIKKNDADEAASTEKHLPWGVPSYADKQILLHNEDFVTSYDVTTKQPRWTAFQITSFKRQIQTPCWTAETRLTEQEMATCSEEFNSTTLKANNLIAEPLFHPNFANNSISDCFSLSNAVLMFEEFQSAIGTALRNQMASFAGKFEKIYAILGPVFDTKSKGNSTPIAIPSHFFAILTRCENLSSKECTPDTLAFLLPHLKKRSPCQSSKRFLELHIARIRDIELKTGLSFFGNLTTLDLRLKLEVDLWGGL